MKYKIVFGSSIKHLSNHKPLMYINSPAWIVPEHVCVALKVTAQNGLLPSRSLICMLSFLLRAAIVLWQRVSALREETRGVVTPCSGAVGPGEWGWHVVRWRAAGEGVWGWHVVRGRSAQGSEGDTLYGGSAYGVCVCVSHCSGSSSRGVHPPRSTWMNFDFQLDIAYTGKGSIFFGQESQVEENRLSYLYSIHMETILYYIANILYWQTLRPKLYQPRVAQ